MGRSLDIFDDEPITLDQIIDRMKTKDENPLMGSTLEKSIEAVKSLPSDNSRALVMDELIDVLLESDLIYLAKRFGDEALDFASNVKVTAEKTKTLSRLANTFSRHGFDNISQKIFENGLREADKLEDDEILVNVFILIAEEQLDDQLIDRAKANLDRALSPALNLAEDKEDIVPLSLVAELKARIGESEAEELCQDALRLSNKFDDQDEEYWVKCSIAKAFLRLGKNERAKTLIEEIKQSGGSDVHLMELGMALSEEGLSESALEIAGDIRNDDLRYPLMRSIATDLIHEDFTKDGLKLVETIEDIFERDLVYKELIEKLLEKGKSGRIYKYLDMMENKEIRALTHKQIGISYLREGKLQRATDHTLKARQLARESKKDSIKLEILDALMEIEGEAALDLAEEIDTAEERAIAFAVIAAKSA